MEKSSLQFVELSLQEYATFEASSKQANLMQATPRAELRKRMGYKTHFLGVKDGKKVVAAGLLVVRGREAWFQHGPLADYSNLHVLNVFLTGALAFCKSNNYYELEVFPPVLLATHQIDGSTIQAFDAKPIFKLFSNLGFTHLGFTQKTEFKALRWMFVKDLASFNNMREAELSFNASTRKKFHQTERNLDIYVLKQKSELSNWLAPLQESNARNHIPTRSLKYFEDIWDLFGENATFVEARLKGTNQIVSSELDFWNANESLAFLAGTIESLKKYNGITAIKGWQLAECLRRGLTRANFYGLDGVFSMNNPLLRAKSGFGGIVEEYIGGFRYVLNPIRLRTSNLTRRIASKLKRTRS
ncbi:peptidoglycan bridge formation glycyltransferase FemA/FemB family protein [Candidatus Saccharibacteria bacterium]|nr:peptidoglycan bridge formation glycyltransferase FemA/FemB family protein [Candidatus Saccharibacteria bacterium]